MNLNKVKENKTKKIRVVVVAGGWSAEREISLKSGKAVYNALDREKYEVSFLDIKEEIQFLFKNREKIDIVFPLLHGRLGEDGSIQGFLNILGIPYVGSDILANAIAMNKKISKEIFEKNGLCVPKALYLKKESYSESSLKDINPFGFPVVVKPVSEGSSFGISLCSNTEELIKGVKKAFEYDEEILIEEYIDGIEITAPVIGVKELEVLPLIEIVPKETHKFFDFTAKYTPGATDEICPARIPAVLEKKAKEAAKIAFNAIGCKVWARVDMIIKSDRVYVLEVNTIPGMTENSLFPLSAKKAGISFSELLDKLISLSLFASHPLVSESSK